MARKMATVIVHEGQKEYVASVCSPEGAIMTVHYGGTKEDAVYKAVTWCSGKNILVRSVA